MRINSDNKFMRVLNALADMVGLGVIWTLLSLTIVGFGPATTALYYTLVKAIRKDRGKPFLSFFQSFRLNFLHGMLLGLLVILLCAAVLFVCAPYMLEPFVTGSVSNGPLFAGALLLIFSVVSAAAYAFPLLSRFNISFIKAFGFGLKLTPFHLPSSILIVLLVCLCLCLMFFFPYLLWLFPCLFMFVISFPMERILRKNTPESACSTDPLNDNWFIE